MAWCWILIFVILMMFGGCYWIYRFAFYSPNKTQNMDLAVTSNEQMDVYHDTIVQMITEMMAIPYEEVYIVSEDGLRLRGRYYHVKDGAPLNICFHGYRGTPARDFSGGARLLLEMGHNVLMIEQRAQCGSEGHTITFGIKERKDCLSWYRYARDRFGSEVKIILVGISMGAATVLMASESLTKKDVCGIIADCPFTSPRDIIEKVAGDMHLPRKISGLLASLTAKIFGGFDLAESSAVEAVKHASVPILLIHGLDDRFVPCEMSYEIQKCNESLIELETFKDAGHGISFLLDKERYAAVISRFSERVLQNQNH